MNISLWIRKAWDFLVDTWLKNKFPQYANLFENASAVLELAGECISAAQATGQDGAAKKEMAAKDLLAKLQERKIDLPGDADLEICRVIIEALVQGLYRFLRLS